MHMTPAEYLAFERASEEKHEYADGEVFAMAGSSWAHGLIAGNLAGELRTALAQQPCAVNGADIKIQAADKRHYHYADVVVVCGPPVFEDARKDVLLNPLLIAEVLSDSTERYDRGAKFASYRTIPTLQDYLLVSQTSVQVEHYHRRSDGTWIFRVLGPDQLLELSSLRCSVPVEGIYAKVFSMPEEALQAAQGSSSGVKGDG